MRKRYECLAFFFGSIQSHFLINDVQLNGDGTPVTLPLVVFNGVLAIRWRFNVEHFDAIFHVVIDTMEGQVKVITLGCSGFGFGSRRYDAGVGVHAGKASVVRQITRLIWSGDDWKVMTIVIALRVRVALDHWLLLIENGFIRYVAICQCIVVLGFAAQQICITEMTINRCLCSVAVVVLPIIIAINVRLPIHHRIVRAIVVSAAIRCSFRVINEVLIIVMLNDSLGRDEWVRWWLVPFARFNLCFLSIAFAVNVANVLMADWFVRLRVRFIVAIVLGARFLPFNEIQ